MSPQPEKARILVVDDHVEMVNLLADQLTDAGYAIELAEGGAEAIAALRVRPFDLVLTDLRMASVDGFDVLEAVRAELPFVPVLIMTAFGAIETAIEAIKRGAYHYITKPFQLQEVLLYVERALADRKLRDENAALQRVATERAGFASMVGRSRLMQDVYALVERVAASQAPVLIRGESGTGKELIARAIHFRGPRAERPFVPVNCTALPESLLESELFGHLRGAYTGATAARRGLFVEADGGTLFLDEIGDMPSGLQGKLLRVIEDGEVRAVGSDVARRVDVRIVAATHHNLEQRVRESAFRNDLFYRLNVVPIVAPPLRERTEDIPMLATHFLREARERNGSPVRELSPEVIAALARAAWPGNVRELENVVERLVVVAAKPRIELDDLAKYAPAIVAEPTPLERAKQQMSTLRDLEADYIAWAVRQCGGNKTRAAEMLGIDVSTIHRRERNGPQ